MQLDQTDTVTGTISKLTLLDHLSTPMYAQKTKSSENSATMLLTLTADTDSESSTTWSQELTHAEALVKRTLLLQLNSKDLLHTKT